MNKEITIYELLGLVKDGQAPTRIKYKGKIYEYSAHRGYIYKNGLSFFPDYFILKVCADEKRYLNEKVEIIEEDNKIEYPLLHKIAAEEKTGDKMPNQEYLIDGNFTALNKAVYELIDEVNKLKEGK